MVPGLDPMPIYANSGRIFGHFVPFMMSLHFCPAAAKDQLSIQNQPRQVNIMAIILFIYSSILAVAVWQEKQNEEAGA